MLGCGRCPRDDIDPMVGGPHEISHASTKPRADWRVGCGTSAAPPARGPHRGRTTAPRTSRCPRGAASRRPVATRRDSARTEPTRCSAHRTPPPEQHGFDPTETGVTRCRSNGAPRPHGPRLPTRSVAIARSHCPNVRHGLFGSRILRPTSSPGVVGRCARSAGRGRRVGEGRHRTDRRLRTRAAHVRRRRATVRPRSWPRSRRRNPRAATPAWRSARTARNPASTATSATSCRSVRRSVTTSTSTTRPASSCCCSKTSRPRCRATRSPAARRTRRALAVLELPKLHAPMWGDPKLSEMAWLSGGYGENPDMTAQFLGMLSSRVQGALRRTHRR